MSIIFLEIKKITTAYATFTFNSIKLESCKGNN